MKKLTVKIITKHEFTQLLLTHLCNDRECWSKETIIDNMLSNGFPKLDFENLNDCLSKMFVWLPTVAVDFGNTQFVWVVSGSNAVLIQMDNLYK